MIIRNINASIDNDDNHINKNAHILVAKHCSKHGHTGGIVSIDSVSDSSDDNSMDSSLDINLLRHEIFNYNLSYKSFTLQNNTEFLNT